MARDLNPTLYETNLDQYEGLEFSHFEDEHGRKLDSLNMNEAVVIVFASGEKITLRPDMRGMEAYISRYTY